jgi:hypothetical protein
LRVYPKMFSLVRNRYRALLVLFVAFLAEHYVQSRGLSYREIIVISVALVGLVAIQTGEWGLKVGFIAWILTLGLGYRTIPLTSRLHIHPGEVVLWGLLALSLIRQATLYRRQDRFWLPWWLWLFLPFWLWGWQSGLQAGQAWDEMFAEFRDFVLLIPLFAVATKVLATRGNWRPILLTFYGTGAWIGGMGVLEYLFPSTSTLLPGFISDPVPVTTAEGFSRARFAFWGGPQATFILVLTLPMAIVVWRWWSAAWLRVLTLLTASLQLAGIYLGGYRSMWLVLAVQFLLFAWARGGFVMGMVSLGLLLAGYHWLPATAQERANSLIMAMEGHPIDTSAAKRGNLARDALDFALKQPLGHGWASAGWVHNDFVQVAANLGLLAGLLFAGAYLVTLLRLWGRIQARLRSGKGGYFGFMLLLSFVAAGGILAMDGVQVLPQLVLPVWFVWVIVEVWLRQTSAKRRAAHEARSDLHPLADLQLRSHRAGNPGVGQVGR